MRMHVLGTSEIQVSNEKHFKHSGVLIDGQILFDSGEAEFLNHNPKAIFVTHLHPGHAYFVLEDQTIPVNTIYAPEQFGSAKNILSLIEKVEVDSYLITPISTLHSKIVKSQAYLVERNGKQVLYTGNMIWIKKEILEIIWQARSCHHGGKLYQKRRHGKKRSRWQLVRSYGNSKSDQILFSLYR